MLHIYFCSFTRERTNIYTHIYKFQQLIVQNKINLSAPGKDHIILTKYKQVYFTRVIIGDLSKHLPEKLKIISNRRQWRSHSTTKDSEKLKALPIAKCCICCKESEEWRRELGK